MCITLTLLDVNARGYVRPICLSYLSREPRKIATHFLDLAREFALAAETLKRGNYDLFRRDVERRIADLEFTRVRLAAPDSAISPPTSHGPTLDEHSRRVATRARASAPNARHTCRRSDEKRRQRLAHRLCLAAPRLRLRS
jgi:hypothetical protein